VNKPSPDPCSVTTEKVLVSTRLGEPETRAREKEERKQQFGFGLFFYSFFTM